MVAPTTIEIWLACLAAYPALMVLAIVAATFVVEDAATIAVGVLASRMLVDPGLAVAALLAGTIVGDFGVYALGRSAGRLPFLRDRRFPVAEAWLRSHGGFAVAIARFLPGARLPVYSTSGFLRMPFANFAALVIVTGLVWTPALFFLSATSADAAAMLGAPAAWLLALLLISILAVPHVLRRPR
jgi:membrane protein DedA with SNARE-associated domain